MSNANAPSGGKILNSLTSAKFMRSIHEYVIPVSDVTDYFVNDFVRTDNTSENGVPICVKAAAGDSLRGLIVGFKADPDFDNVTARFSGERRAVFVCDDPFVLFEIQANGIVSDSDIGKFADFAVGSGQSGIGLSDTQLDTATISSSTGPLKIIRRLDNPVNEMGNNVKLICIIYDHELNGSSSEGIIPHNNLSNLAYDVAGHGTGYAGFQRGTTLSAIDPTVTNDDSENYVVGDFWVNTVTSRAFLCVDTTTGAAVWDQLEHSINDIWERNDGTGVVTLANPTDILSVLNIRNVEVMGFDTAAGASVSEGQVAWDNDAGTLIIGMPGGNVSLQSGQEMYLPDRPKNDEGIQIDNGQVVYISGATGSVPQAKLADASDFTNASKTLAVATEDVASNQRGYYTAFGVVRDFDTSAWADGDELWLDSTPGGLTNVMPSAPNAVVRMGFVLRSHASEGSVFMAIHVNQLATITEITREPTGFTENQNVVVTYDDSARTITLTGTVNAYYKGAPVSALTSGWVSDPHSAVNDEYFLIYDGTSFSWVSPATLEFHDLFIAFVNYGAVDKWAIRECHGLMQWQSHQEAHEVTGTYRQSGGTLGDYTLASTTAADRRPSVTATVVKDEDIPTTNPLLAADGPYTQFTLSSTDTANFDIAGLDIVPLSGSRPYYNEFTGGAWQQTLISNAAYMSIWLVALPATADSTSQNYRYFWVQGQAEHNTLAGEQGVGARDVSLGEFSGLAPEYIFITQVIIRYIGADWNLIEIVDLIGSKGSFGSSSGLFLSAVTTDVTLTGIGTVSDPLSVVTTFLDDAFAFSSAADPTALVSVDLSNITTATTRTLTMADRNLDLADPVFDSTNVRGALTFGTGADVQQDIITFDNSAGTLPVITFETATGGFASTPGLKWETAGAGVDNGFQVHSVGGAAQLFVTSGDTIETETIHLGYAPSGVVNSGTNWMFQYDATTDDLIFKSNNAGSIVDRMTIDFASGVISANTANYETLVTADAHLINKKYLDDLIPVKEIFWIVATASQTAFTLPSSPASPTLVTAFRNGVEALYGTNFTVSGSTLTWLDVPAALVAGETISGFYNETGLSKLFNIIDKSASDTAALQDASSVIEYTNGASDYTYTLPQNSAVAFPIGSWIEIRKTGSGEITITKGAGATFRGALGDVNAKIDGSDGYSAFLEKTATDTWLLSGSVKEV